MAENNQAMHDYFSAKEKAAVEKKSTDSPPDRSALSLAALVAEFWRRAGKRNLPRADWYNLPGVVIECGEDYTICDVAVVGADHMECEANGTTQAACRLSDLDRFPGVRNALVGAVREWLRENTFSHAVGSPIDGSKTTVVRYQLTDRSERLLSRLADDVFTDPDPLRALLLAALAVADQKEQAK